jgi:hypothetical protein
MCLEDGMWDDPCSAGILNEARERKINGDARSLCNK